VEPRIDSIIFGYGFKARSGKDSAVAAIIEERGDRYSIKRYGFADELKREVTVNALKSGGIMNLFSDGLREEGCGFLQTNGNFLALPDWVQPEADPDMSDPLCPLGKFRSLLQWWGGEYRRGADQNYWIKKIAQRIADEKPEIALISDLRYFNEAVFVQTYGDAVKVNRPNLPQLSGASAQHSSETELENFDGWDDVILNDGDLETLRERALFSFDMLMSAVPVTRPASD
jgi:hypothetical protein